MKRNEVITILKDCEDVYFHEGGSKYADTIWATIEDFDGFDEDWNEVMVDYDENAVTRMERLLAEGAEKVERDFYDCYYFEDCKVIVGYASYDI